MLFKGHEDLLVEFVNFLPSCSESTSTKNEVPLQKVHFVFLKDSIFCAVSHICDMMLNGEMNFGHSSFPLEVFD